MNGAAAGPRAPQPPLLVGISGASGVIFGVRLLSILRKLEIDAHLIMSHSAKITLRAETDFKAADVETLAAAVYSNRDLGAACSSGSFLTRGMIIAPCSIKTLSEIAFCPGGTLLSRAADVTLKERRRLVLMLRETPLHLGHIRSMLAVTEAGAIVYPPVAAYYTHPKTLEDAENHTIGRVLDLFGIETGLTPRWSGTQL